MRAQAQSVCKMLAKEVSFLLHEANAVSAAQAPERRQLRQTIWLAPDHIADLRFWKFPTHGAEITTKFLRTTRSVQEAGLELPRGVYYAECLPGIRIVLDYSIMEAIYGIAFDVLALENHR